MRKTVERSSRLVGAISFCAALGLCSVLGAWGSPAAALEFSPKSAQNAQNQQNQNNQQNQQNGQAVLVTSELRCYATHGEPDAVVCYRVSDKAEYRHGRIVYIPRLIQVPVPANPPPVTIVDSLNDVHPG